MTIPADYLSIYRAIRQVSQNTEERAKYSEFRAKHLPGEQVGLIKQAFDTRRINQNTELNPRRNLQNYQRSEPYIDDKMAGQIKLLFKVKEASDSIRELYIGEPDWLDSHSRILCNAIDQTLRIEQKDFDYGRSQLDYISELLYVRYRLAQEDIALATPEELRKVFLAKDEKLTRQSIRVNYKDDLFKQNALTGSDMHKESTLYKQPMVIQPQDPFIERLFGSVKASPDKKSVSRSVTITINDSILDPPEEKTASEAPKAEGLVITDNED